jgi:hypothetical protein
VAEANAADVVAVERPDHTFALGARAPCLVLDRALQNPELTLNRTDRLVATQRE